jgi:hypothetical protein
VLLVVGSADIVTVNYSKEPALARGRAGINGNGGRMPVMWFRSQKKGMTEENGAWRISCYQKEAQLIYTEGRAPGRLQRILAPWNISASLHLIASGGLDSSGHPVN